MKQYSEACEQNKAPILEVLKIEFANHRKILEIGSGSGQHATYFGQQLPHLIWQTSDLPEHHSSICAWIADSDTRNVLAPVELNTEKKSWPREKYDGVFSANTSHIMHWQQVEAMFTGIQNILEDDGTFCLYGPFNYSGEYTSPSNQRFNAWLQQRDPHSGLRDFEDLEGLAKSFGWSFVRDHAMPANNRTLVWRK